MLEISYALRATLAVAGAIFLSTAAEAATIFYNFTADASLREGTFVRSGGGWPLIIPPSESIGPISGRITFDIDLIQLRSVNEGHHGYEGGGGLITFSFPSAVTASFPGFDSSPAAASLVSYANGQMDFGFSFEQSPTASYDPGSNITTINSNYLVRELRFSAGTGLQELGDVFVGNATSGTEAGPMYALQYAETSFLYEGNKPADYVGDNVNLLDGSTQLSRQLLLENFAWVREVEDVVEATARTFGLFIGVRDAGGGESVPEFRGDTAANLLAAAFNELDNSFGVAITGDRINGEGVSLQEMQDELNSISGKMRPGDKLFLYATGHGGSLPGFGFGNEIIVLGNEDNKLSFTDDVLTSMLSGMPDVEKVIFLDSCYSGGFWGSGDLNEIFDNGDLENLENIALIASSSEYRAAYFGSDGLPLTSLGLLDAWSMTSSGYRKADFNKDGVTNISEIYLSIGAYMQGRSGETVFEMDFGDQTVFDPVKSGPVLFASADFRGNLSSAVPEPEIWSSLIVGFGFIGSSIRRRRARVNCKICTRAPL